MKTKAVAAHVTTQTDRSAPLPVASQVPPQAHSRLLSEHIALRVVLDAYSGAIVDFEVDFQPLGSPVRRTFSSASLCPPTRPDSA